MVASERVGGRVGEGERQGVDDVDDSVVVAVDVAGGDAREPR